MNQQEKVMYSQDEINKFAEMMAKEHNTILLLKAEAKQTAKDIREQIDEKEKRVDDLADKITKGYYWQDPIRVGE